MSQQNTSGTSPAPDLKGESTAIRKLQKLYNSTPPLVIGVVLFVIWALLWHYGIGGLWVHLVLVACVGLVVMRPRNIETNNDEIPRWEAGDLPGSLSRIHSYVIAEAGKSIAWYWKAKRSKALLSRFIRFVAWILAAIAGLLPAAVKVFPAMENWKPWGLANPLWASLLLGMAAALVGLDKAFGYSSGWTRYVLTATNLRKTLEEFRMDWTELMAKAGKDPTPDNVALLIERAKKFRADVDGLVLQETKDWVTEFQSNMAQLEKDVSTQLASLKSKVDDLSKKQQ